MTQRLLVSTAKREIQTLPTLLTREHGVNVMKSSLKSLIGTSFIGFKLAILLKGRTKHFGVRFSFQTTNIEKMLLNKLCKLHFQRPRMRMKYHVQ